MKIKLVSSKEKGKKMKDFKSYHVVIDIDFLNNHGLLGNYHNTCDSKLEMKAINKYKDAIWEIQGLINNSISINQDFYINANITLYGITFENDYIIMRHLELTL